MRRFCDDQIQPASLDLRLGEIAYRLRASFLPGAGAKVRDRLDDELVMHKIDLTQGAVLETGCVYLVQVQEELALPRAYARRGQSEEFDRPCRCVHASDPRWRDFVRLRADGLSRADVGGDFVRARSRCWCAPARA